MWSDKGKRSWLASFVFITLIVGLIFFLTFLEIPDQNKDLISSIIGMLVGSISTVISIFVGRDPDDVKTLKEAIADLNGDRTALIQRLRDAQIDKDTLRKQLESLQSQVIDKLSIFVGQHKLADIGNNRSNLNPEVDRWIPNPQKDPLPDFVTPIPNQNLHAPKTEPPKPAPPEKAVEGEIDPAGFDDWIRDFGDEDK